MKVILECRGDMGKMLGEDVNGYSLVDNIIYAIDYEAEVVHTTESGEINITVKENL